VSLPTSAFAAGFDAGARLSIQSCQFCHQLPGWSVESFSHSIGNRRRRRAVTGPLGARGAGDGLVDEALALTVCAPSNSNVQPWHWCSHPERPGSATGAPLALRVPSR